LTPNKLLACPKSKNEGKRLNPLFRTYEFLPKKSRGTPQLFSLKLETFYDENARQTLPSDVRCYSALLKILQNNIEKGANNFKNILLNGAINELRIND